MCKKKKLKARFFTCQLESIVLDCFGTVITTAALLFLSEFCDQGSTAFEVYYQRLIDLALIPSKCDRWDKAMFLLALLDSRRHFRASYMYYWNS